MGAVVFGDLGNRTRRNVLVARVGHLERGRKIGPELEAVHTPLRVTLRHLLVQNAAACRHPLHIASRHMALVAKRIAVVHLACQHIGDGLDTPVGMPDSRRGYRCGNHPAAGMGRIHGFCRNQRRAANARRLLRQSVVCPASAGRREATRLTSLRLHSIGFRRVRFRLMCGLAPSTRAPSSTARCPIHSAPFAE